MEEEIDPSPEYVAAFNLGYKLNKVSPEIVELLDHLPTKNAKVAALKAGAKQFETEQDKDLMPNWMKDLDQPAYEKEKDIEPDLDKDHDLE